MRSKTSLLLSFLILFILGTACGGEQTPTPIQIPSETQPPAPTPAPTQPPPTETALPPEPEPTPSLATQPTTVPPSRAVSETVPLEPSTWHGSDGLALFTLGDEEQADLYLYTPDRYTLDTSSGAGITETVLADVGRDVTVSPDGRWLGAVHYAQDGSAALVLRHFQTGGTQQLAPGTTSGMLRFIFDPAGRRLAYLDLGGPAAEAIPWALVIVDLETDAVARYEARMSFDDNRPLPGAPVSLLGDELIIDTFMPYTEGGWMGVWRLTLPEDGASAPLHSLPSRELIPAQTYRSPLHLAPDRQSVAFMSRDPDYMPDNYFPEFYDLAVNQLEVAALDDGARTTVVRADDGSALANAAAWSPGGERLLFAQGFYEGENFATLTLKSSDLTGNVTAHGTLTLPPLGGLFELAWCTDTLALYTTWDGRDGSRRLYRFNLDSGTATQIGAGQRAEIVGCAP